MWKYPLVSGDEEPPRGAGGREEAVFELLVKLPHVDPELRRVPGHFGDAQVIIELPEVQLRTNALRKPPERLETAVDEREVLVAELELEEGLQERAEEGERVFRGGGVGLPVNLLNVESIGSCTFENLDFPGK